MLQRNQSNHEEHNEAYETESKEMEKPENKNTTAKTEAKEPSARYKWNQLEFLFSCISLMIGLGNIWRFPFVAYNNGGGAFIIPYITVLLILSTPMYYMESCMGQFSSLSCIKLWAVQPFFKGIGYAQTIATWLITTIYVSISAMSIFYMAASVNSVLPWSICPSNVADCVDMNTNFSTTDNNFTGNNSISAAEIYFQNEVIKLHPNGLDDGIHAPNLNLFICLSAAWILLFLLTVKGVRSFGKVAYFTALFPYIALFVLLGISLTLPGSVNGIKYFIIPQWDKLLDPRVWFAAVGQSFFSMNVGFGGISILSSFNKFRQDIYRDAFIVVVIDSFTSLLAGATIFSILGYQAHFMGVSDVNSVIRGGGSVIAFVTYPEVLARLPVGGQVLSFLFFFMLLTLGIGSAAGAIVCVVSVICDQFPSFRRLYVIIFIIVVSFLISIMFITPQGPHLIILIDFYGGAFIIYFIAFLETIAINWFYGCSNFKRDIKFMLNRDTGIYWTVCWTFIIPLLLMTIMVYLIVIWEPLKSGEYEFGAGATGFGFSIFTFTLAMLPVCFIVSILQREKGLSVWKAIANNFRANEEWYPKDINIREQYVNYLKVN